MPRLTKAEKASKARLLALRPKSLLALMNKKGILRIGPVFPEVKMTETDVVSDVPGIRKYRRKRQIRKRIASHSQAWNAAHS